MLPLRLKMAIVVPSVQRAEVESCTMAKFGKWLKILVFCVITIIIYGRVAVDLAVDWWTIPSQSQGLLIPPLALYIAWERRNITLGMDAAPSNTGLLAVACACGMFLIGKLGAEFFLMRLSLVILLIGLTWTFW